VYRGVGEVSIYVAKESAGEGVGSQLMLSLITRSELLGFWALQATIFPENSASMALHSKYKFRRVGQRNALGKMHGKWRDVELLERRSESVGTD
jgi:phosphinothricin acetyltransferase